ncbi:MAG: YkgJ family cysteine cluster protein [Candidatus Helarchaeota archaeon]
MERDNKFPLHPFHRWIPYLLKNVIILNSQAVYDTIRTLFTTRIALQAPNCLFDCSDNYACCHGNYLINAIDYHRILAHDLIPPTYFTKKGNEYRLKLVKEKNKRTHCIALDVKTKRCLIQDFKPPTCCKYPLISNIHHWSAELCAWTGNCAHSTKLWATRVHPAIMNSLRDLWIRAQVLWEKEQEVFMKIKGKLKVDQNPELFELISHILSIRQSNWGYSSKYLKSFLLKSYPRSSIDYAFKLLK